MDKFSKTQEVTHFESMNSFPNLRELCVTNTLYETKCKPTKLGKLRKQAGAELGQAQPQLGLR